MTSDQVDPVIRCPACALYRLPVSMFVDDPTRPGYRTAKCPVCAETVTIGPPVAAGD